MDMKLRGMYIARQLSFHGVTFKIEEVPLSKEFEKVYDESVLLVSLAAAKTVDKEILRFLKIHKRTRNHLMCLMKNNLIFISVGRSNAKIYRGSRANRC